MKTLNNCSFVGGIVQNPADRLTIFEGGGAVLRISLAIETPDVKQTGEPFTRTAYARLVLWNELAHEVARKRKGDKIEVDCVLQTGAFTDRDGARRNSIEFKVLAAKPVAAPAPAAVTTKRKA